MEAQSCVLITKAEDGTPHAKKVEHVDTLRAEDAKPAQRNASLSAIAMRLLLPWRDNVTKMDMEDSMRLIYLACPYSDESKEVRQQRVKAATMHAAEIMKQGDNVFSPITHSDPIADHLPEHLRLDHEFWMNIDLQILRRCDSMTVLAIDGWMQSKGVQAEIDFANKNNIPVQYVKSAKG